VLIAAFSASEAEGSSCKLVIRKFVVNQKNHKKLLMFICVKNASVTSGKPVVNEFILYLQTTCKPHFDANNTE